MPTTVQQGNAPNPRLQYANSNPNSNSGQGTLERHLSAKVDSLMDKYAHITSTHPSLEQFGKDSDFYALFRKVFTHHVLLVKSRPQELERGYITVYDSALMRMTAGGRDMSHKGAIALFLEQILGVKKADYPEDLEVILKGNVAMRSALLESVEGCKKQDETATTRAILSSSPVPQGPRDARFTRIQSRPSGGELRTHDPDAHVSQLLLTFTNAQYEYSSTPETAVWRKKQAAKFLRDSAENALAYLRASQPDHYMIPNLKRTFEMAQNKCIGLNGGRKRPFEMNEEEYAKRTRRTVEYRSGTRVSADRYRPE